MHVCILGTCLCIHLRQIPSVEVEMDSGEAKTGGSISNRDVVGRIQARDDGDLNQSWGEAETGGINEQVWKTLRGKIHRTL